MVVDLVAGSRGAVGGAGGRHRPGGGQDTVERAERRLTSPAVAVRYFPSTLVARIPGLVVATPSSGVNVCYQRANYLRQSVSAARPRRWCIPCGLRS